MEENRKELNPEEMENVSGGRKPPRSPDEPVFECPECHFQTTDYKKFHEHLESHSRPYSITHPLRHA